MEPRFERGHSLAHPGRLLVEPQQVGQRAFDVLGVAGQLFLQGHDPSGRHGALFEIRRQGLAQFGALRLQFIDCLTEGLARLLLVLFQRGGQRFKLRQLLVHQPDIVLQLEQLRGLSLEVIGERGEGLAVGLAILFEGG